MVATNYIKLKSKGEADSIEITSRVASCVHDSDKKTGITVIFVPGSTGVLARIEYETGLV